MLLMLNIVKHDYALLEKVTAVALDIGETIPLKAQLLSQPPQKQTGQQSLPRRELTTEN